jgi:hypothetical protein
MSIEIIEKEPHVQEGEIDKDDNFNYSDLIISFSDFFHKIELLDVYTGIEDIPFEERASEYKEMLKAEFL